MRKRPLGITILAVLFALGVAQYAVLAALAVFNRAALDSFLRALSPSGAGPETLHTAMGAWLPVYYLAMAGLTGAMAWAFWRLKNWARLAMLGLIGLSLGLMLGELPGLIADPAAKAVGLTLLRVALSALWAWYLLRRPVREAFRPPGDEGATLARAHQSRPTAESA
jgi:hypothetical protein